MKNRKKYLAGMARMLVLTLLIGIFSAVWSEEASAASNKALRVKAVFDGTKDTEEAWQNNRYTLTAGYKNPVRLKKNMKISAAVYVPAASLKKDGDTVHIRPFAALTDIKGGSWLGDIRSNYTVILMKQDKKVSIGLWNETKQKVEKAGRYASVKKSGKYYVVTMKNLPLQNQLYGADGKPSALNVKSKFYAALSVDVTGMCAKTSGYIYADDLKLQAAKTHTITFNKKDYYWVSGWHKASECKVKVAAIK